MEEVRGFWDGGGVLEMTASKVVSYESLLYLVVDLVLGPWHDGVGASQKNCHLWEARADLLWRWAINFITRESRNGKRCSWCTDTGFFCLFQDCKWTACCLVLFFLLRGSFLYFVGLEVSFFFGHTVDPVLVRNRPWSLLIEDRSLSLSTLRFSSRSLRASSSVHRYVILDISCIMSLQDLAVFYLDVFDLDGSVSWIVLGDGDSGTFTWHTRMNLICVHDPF